MMRSLPLVVRSVRQVVPQFRRRIDNGELRGPHIITTGEPVSQPAVADL
jgi:hypothetical protein